MLWGPDWTVTWEFKQNSRPRTNNRGRAKVQIGDVEARI